MKASDAIATRSSCSSWASLRSSSSGRSSLCEGLAARGFRVVRFDNRDIGKSTHLAQYGTPNVLELMQQAMAGRQPQAPYSLSDMAADTVGLMNALDVGRAHVVGASMGGMIAQLVAINHPGQDEKPDLDHVDHRTAGPSAGQSRCARPADPGAEEFAP